MAVIQVQGPQSGKSYSVKIAGEVPTDEEYARINSFVKGAEADYADRFESAFGEPAPEIDDGTALGRGFDRGVQQAKSLIGTTVETIGEQTGIGAIDRFGEGMEESARQALGELAIAQPDRTRWQDVQGLGSGLTYFGELAGEQAPQLIAGLGAAGAATLAVPSAPILAPVAAAGLVTAPMLFGGNVQRQEEQVALGEKESVDLGVALAATFGQAALEGVASKLLLGGALKPVGANIKGVKGLFVRTGSRAAGGAASESLTEVGQQLLERAQAGLPIDDDAAIEEYIEAGIAGGVLGGATRAAGIGESRPAPEPKDKEAPGTPEAPEVARVATAQAETTQAETAQAETPRLQPDQDVGELFTDLPEQRTVEPLTLTPEQRIREGEQMRLPLPEPEVRERPEVQQEMDLALPEGGQADMFGTTPPVGKSAVDVLDALNIAPRAPVRRRLATAVSTDPRLRTELEKYSRLPGVNRETRDTIKGYLETGTLPAVEPKPQMEAPLEQVVEPTAELQPQPRQTETDGATDAATIDQERIGDDVPSPAQSMDRGRGGGDSGPADTAGAQSPDMGRLGEVGPDAPLVANTATTQPDAVIRPEQDTVAPAPAPAQSQTQPLAAPTPIAQDFTPAAAATVGEPKTMGNVGGTVSPAKGLKSPSPAAISAGLGFNRKTSKQVEKVINEQLYTSGAVVDAALSPDVAATLVTGDMVGALNILADTAQNSTLSKVARRFANLIAGTNIEIVDSIDGPNGRDAPGLFDPDTNTIRINRNTGLTTHTMLHEVAHALTSASIANRSLPTTAQLRTIFDNVRGQIGEVYGTQNLDEFVAEAMSNPQFQAMLAQTKPDTSGVNPFKKFSNAVRQIVRRALGKDMGNLTEVNKLIDSILAPAPDSRSAGRLYANSSVQDAKDNLSAFFGYVPQSNKNTYDNLKGYMSGITPRIVKDFIAKILHVDVLAGIASDRIPFAKELPELIDRASGALRKRIEPIQLYVNDLRKYKKENPEGYKSLGRLITRSTLMKVDPSMKRAAYDQYRLTYTDLVTKKTTAEFFPKLEDRTARLAQLNASYDPDKRSKARASGDPDSEAAKMWDELNAQYAALGENGQKIYRTLRNYFEGQYASILPALRARIETEIPEGEARQAAFEKLAAIFEKQAGVIRPYFPLTRAGKFRLEYQAVDPQAGNVEVYVEYFPSLRRMREAAQKVREYNANSDQSTLNGNIKEGLSSSMRDYSQAPSNSFVYNVLKEIEAAGISDPVLKGKIVDLALDAMPERSVMQQFRRREGVRGALGDVTPTGIPDAEFDLIDMVETKGQGFARQITNLEYGAQIQGFRNKLIEGGYLTNTTDDTDILARHMDKIASFAQNPEIAKWAQVVNSVGFAWTMGANPSSAFLPLFDVVMGIAPLLSGEHGAFKTISAIGDATRTIAKTPRKKVIMALDDMGNTVERELETGVAGFDIANIDYDSPDLPKEFRYLKALSDLFEQRGQVNQTMNQEHLEMSGSKDVLEKINLVSSFMFHHSERYTRQVGAVAAYNLELKKITDASKRPPTDVEMAAAAEKAFDAIQLSMGSTAGAGRSVLAQMPVGNVVMLFKRFAVSKYYMMSKMLDDSLKGASPEDRKIARKQLAHFLVTTGLFSGASGMPLMGALGAIYNMFADEGEDDFEAVTRKMLGEGIYGGLANSVLGVDIASRVSMNSLLYRPPFIDKDQSPLFTLIEQLGGPVVSIQDNFFRGLETINEGDTQRGLETMVPASVRNLMKSVRYATEGMETKRGDEILEDINAYNIAAQSLGFAPEAYIQALSQNKNARRRFDAVNSKRTHLLKRLNMARREGDRDAYIEAVEAINEWNNSLPEDYLTRRIDSDAIKKSRSSFDNNTKKMRNGMTYTPEMLRGVDAYGQGLQLLNGI